MYWLTGRSIYRVLSFIRLDFVKSFTMQCQMFVSLRLDFVQSKDVGPSLCEADKVSSLDKVNYILGYELREECIIKKIVV